MPKFGKDISKNEVETLRGPGYYDTSIKRPIASKPQAKNLHRCTNSLDFSLLRRKNLETPGPGHYNVSKPLLNKKSIYSLTSKVVLVKHLLTVLREVI